MKNREYGPDFGVDVDNKRNHVQTYSYTRLNFKCNYARDSNTVLERILNQAHYDN